MLHVIFHVCQVFSPLHTHTTASAYPHRGQHTWWFFAILIKVEGCQSQIDAEFGLHMILRKECVWATRLWGDVDCFHGVIGESAHVRGDPYHHLVHHGRKLVGFRSTAPRAFVLRMPAPPMGDFAWVSKLTPPRVVSLGSDLSKEALFIKSYQMTCICIYPLKEHMFLQRVLNNIYMRLYS